MSLTVFSLPQDCQQSGVREQNHRPGEQNQISNSNKTQRTLLVMLPVGYGGNKSSRARLECVIQAVHLMESPSECSGSFVIFWTHAYVKIHIVKLACKQHRLSELSLPCMPSLPLEWTKPWYRWMRDSCGFSQIAHVFEPQIHQPNWNDNSNLQLFGRIDWNKIFII